MNAAGNRSEELRRPRFLARWIRRLAVPIILGWTLLLVALNVLVPQLEVVAAKNSVSMSPSNAPSMLRAECDAPPLLKRGVKKMPITAFHRRTALLPRGHNPSKPRYRLARSVVTDYFWCTDCPEIVRSPPTALFRRHLRVVCGDVS